MKKVYFTLIFTLLLTACAPADSAEPPPAAAETTTTTAATTAAAVTPTSQQSDEDYEIYETDGISYHIPKTWKFINTDNESKEYKKFKADNFTFSVQFHEDYSIDISLPDSEIITALERKYSKADVVELKHLKVGKNDCIYFVCRDQGESADGDTVKLACQSKNGVVYFNFFDNSDMDIKTKALDSFAQSIDGNQSFTAFFDANSLKNLSNWENDNLKEFKIDDFSFKLPSSYKCSEEDTDIVCNAVDGMIQIKKTGSEPIDMIPLVTDAILESFTEAGAIITDQALTDNNIFLYQYKHENGRNKIYTKGAFLNTNKQILFCQVSSYKSADEAAAAFEKFYSTFAFDTPKTTTTTKKKETTAEKTTTKKATTTTAPKTTTAETTTTKPTDVGSSMAIRSAQSYLSFMAFSRTGLIHQLEYEGYSHTDAEYAADNCGANWTNQAAKKAQEYLSTQAFSRSGLIKQLEYEGFSQSDATYGTDAAGADWNQQAAKKAQDYISIMSFSRDGLIKQLEYEGFTAEQAAYGASAVGY